MKITRIYTGDDDRSYFEDIHLSLFEAEIGKTTIPIDIEKVIFGVVENPQVITWHNAPRRQFIIMLEGSMEIEIGDGTKRIFNVGDVVLAEDLTGQGHITRAASQGPRRYMALPLK